MTTLPVRAKRSRRASPLRATLLSTFLSTQMLAGCSGPDDGDRPGVGMPPLSDGSEPLSNPAPNPVPDVGAFASMSTDLVMDPSLYARDGYARVDVIRIDLRTVARTGSACTEDDQSGCTLADVLGDTDTTDELKVDVPVHFRAGDFAEDGTSGNAELRQRGGGSRSAPQKSFRIKLDSQRVLWRGERFLQLNKHPFESSRFRNKAAFDLMQGVPHLPSFRTQFVNLWIDDGSGPVDNGLYTHVERFDDDWLKRRGLPGDGNLYSANDFRFAASDLADVAVDGNGEPLDKDRFESSLEIDEGEDHRALVRMLQAIQNADLDFGTVLDRHFNRNNVLAWITFNLLVRQDDATRQNVKLYNPAGSDRFYFVPWDYDAVFGQWEEPPGGYSTEALQQRLDYGYALGHRNDFLDGYYRMPGTHGRVLAAVEVLRDGALTDTAIQRISDTYHDLVAPLQTRAPDRFFNESFTSASGRDLAARVAGNEEAIRTRFALPLPPTLLDVTRVGPRILVRWTPALDVTGSAVTYDLEIATSPAFGPDSIVFTRTGIADRPGGTVESGVDPDRLGSGRRYARLTARASNDPSRHWQVARNRLTVGGSEYLGTISFEVR